MSWQADERIDQLEAENERLRAALREMLKWWDEDDMDFEIYERAKHQAEAALNIQQRKGE